MADVILLRALSCLLYAERIRDNTSRIHSRIAPRHPILGQVYQPLAPVWIHDALNTGSSRQHRSQDWSVSRLWLAAAELLSASLPTPEVADLWRLSPSPCTVVQVQLLLKQSLAPLEGAH